MASLSAAIHAAADRGDLKEVMALVQRDSSLLNAQDAFFGRAPLTSAAGQGRIEVVRYLLRQGADVNHQAACGWTPLFRSVRWGHIAVVSLLLERGARVALADNVGLTPLMLTCLWGHIEVLKLLLRHGGSDVDAVDHGGRTALLVSASHDRTDEARLLLLAGADPFIADAEGQTPLEKAIINGNHSCTRLLRVSGTPAGSLRVFLLI